MTELIPAVLLEPWALALFGACIGSFLNVVAHRTPRMLERQWWGDAAGLLADDEARGRFFGSSSAADAAAVLARVQGAAQAIETRLEGSEPVSLSRPRSRCPACGHQIAWHENIPVLGYLLLRGRCSACSTPIGWRYPAVELGTALLFAAIAWRFGPTVQAVLWCAVVSVLMALALIDWDTTLLPDHLTLPLLWAGLLASWAGLTGVSLESSLLGAVAGYGSLWAVYWAFRLLTGKEGMGAGDFKLLAALGAWLGWPALLPILIVASVAGAIVGIGMKALSRLRGGAYVPFGPFLAAGGLLLILFGGVEWIPGLGVAGPVPGR